MSRIGLVLGAGGFGGRAFHAGVLAALEEGLGWDPRDAEVIVGTSAGSQVGTALRIGISAHDLATRIAGEPVSAEGSRIFARLGPPPTDVATAVAASCAVPWLFAPVEIDGVRYVDGGVISPTNLDLLAGLGLDLAIVISPMSVGGRPSRKVDLPLRRFFRLRLGREAARVRRTGTRGVAFQPAAEEMAALGLNAMDPDPVRWRAAIRRVREATLRRLDRADFV